MDELNDRTLLVVGIAFGVAVAAALVGYLFDPHGYIGDSVPAGVGFLIGLGIAFVAIGWIVVTGGWGRFRHSQVIKKPVIDPAPGESVESAAGRFLAKTGLSDIRFGMGVVVICVAGAVACLVGGLHERSLTQPEPGWIRTTGRIESQQLTGCKGGCEWATVVAFTVPTAGTFRFEPPNTRDQPVVGAAVQIAYQRSNPSSAHDLSDTDNDGGALIWLSPIVLLVGVSTGAVTILLGRSDLRRANQLRRTQEGPETAET